MILAAMCQSVVQMAAQDLVPVSSVTGGSSVFVFRSSSKPSRKYVAPTRTPRTKTQRLETAKKIKRQYDTLAKNAPRRVRSATVDPDNLPPAVKSMPKDQASRLFAGVGEYYIDKEEPDKSADFFREALNLDPNNIKAKEGLSDALAAKGNELILNDRSDQARAFFLESLKTNPKNAAAYFGLGQVFSDSDKDDEAIASYEKALENDAELTEIYLPLGILYFEKGEIAKADELLTKALTKSSESAETQLFLGVIRSSQNRNAEAIAAFDKAKALDPTSAEAFMYSGEALVRAEKYEQAAADYQKAVSLRSNYFEAWRGLGSAYVALADYPKAVEALKEAVKLKSDNPEVAVSLGDAYRLSGDYNQAYGSYDLATLFMSRGKDYSNDEQAEIYSKIGFVIGRQCELNIRAAMPCSWPAAIAALEKARELGGSNAADIANLGWAYYNAARIDQFDKKPDAARAKLELAKKNLQLAVDGKPAYIEGPLLNLGMVLTDLGDYNGAVEALKKAVEKEPKWLFALNELGIAYRKLDKYKEAAETFKTAFEKDDKYAYAHYNWGESEFRSGNLKNAKKAYQKLKELGRNDLAVQLEAVTGGAVKK